jgi:hypothetical protein
VSTDESPEPAPEVPSAPRPGGDPVKPLPGPLAFVGMGSTVAGCVAVGVVLGIVVDDRLHSSPAFLVVGLVLGVVAAVVTVTTQVRRFL